VADGEAGDLIAELALRIERDGADGHPDYPVVTILVDGREAFARHDRHSYKGFSPAQILGPDSPLLPQAAPRRVAIYRCSCGITSCGCVAPLISWHGDQVRWSDFRDFTGIFDGPATQASPDGGMALPFPGLVFDASSYRAEIERASADRSWQTAGWQAAHLLWQILDRARGQLARLGWVPDGIRSAYQPGQFDVWLTDTSHREQIRIRLTAASGTPADRARHMADTLTSTHPGKWPVTRRQSLIAADPELPDD
jgi:hypothetical protein